MMTDRDSITRTRARALGRWGSHPLWQCIIESRPDSERDHRSDHEVHEGRRQTGRRPAHAGSRLKLIDAPGRSRLICQPSSRTGENPPYGMIGGIEETSASFEARSAPRSHPTNADITRVPSATKSARSFVRLGNGLGGRHRTMRCGS